MPGISRTGRKLMYWRNCRRIGMYAGKADCAEKNGVVHANLIEPAGRHHRARLGVAPAAPVEVVPGETQTKAFSRGVNHADPFGDDFLSDPVAGDHRDAIAFHTPRTFHSGAALYLSAIGGRP
jgi:hypothetical protein